MIAPRRAAPGASLPAVVIALALAGCLQPGVVRVVDGQERTGDFVTPTAYAAYARGAIAEREGRYRDAARDFAIAADDSGDPAAYARLGAACCALGDTTAARRAFDEGASRDPEASVVHRERAACALRRRAYEEAAASAALAVRLDPDDGEAVQLLTTALRSAGREADADALVAEARAKSADPRRGDDRARRAERARAAAGATLPAAAADPGADLAASLRTARPALADVDAALAQGDLETAARLATSARVGRADLAARALAHGHRAFAAATAQRVLAADPGNATAWCVAAAADDEASGGETLRARLLTLPHGAPSPLASLLHAELLLRRGGREAAAAWAPRETLEATRADPLEDAARRRLQVALAPR